MSFLSTSRFAQPDPDFPAAVKISRIVLWIQGLGMILMAGLFAQSILGLRSLSSGELEERFDGEIVNQAEVPYGSMWLMTAVMLAVGVALAYCAWQLNTRARKIRLTAVIVEGGFLALAVFAGDIISCFLAVLGIVVLISFMREPAKSWFDDGEGKPPQADAEAQKSD